MRTSFAASVIVATLVLGAGLAFAQSQHADIIDRPLAHDPIYISCLHAADARVEGVRLDLMTGKAAKQITLRNRAMRAHCAAYGANQAHKWVGFEQSCRATAADSGVVGVALTAQNMATMQQVCTSMAAAVLAAN
ncbi:hypothetical protein PbB2_02659 [Candidatus Phycosocius bacilliformis]|uniref:Lysozyme inhibitor LprI N-terminal domain-containing protein n=1 Tax=Candidatus Phycosocius bacilliformis TaxID=1445552 RepID=A0A2P2ED23_9PROT|nr:hypothetical protein [Candidatus Phycosocius bacilliformis]GBF58968.1 hypothetical protein PbB2_02659 [Candidatus Phycosocius bacilliformis]